MILEKLPHAIDWLTLITLLSFALVAFFKTLYAKRFVAFLKLPMNSSYFSEISQEKEHPFWFVVFTESILIIGITQFIFLLVALSGSGSQIVDYSLFLRILLIGLLFFTLQRFMHSLTGYLFETKKSFTQFMQIKDGHLQWAGLLLLVLNVLIVYSPIAYQVSIYIGVFLLVALYTLGVIRATIMVGTETLNPLQLFFYLCALEILPVLVLVKWLS
jgi:hypothetical protein